MRVPLSRLQPCKLCRRAYYCSTECQTEAWSLHKTHCDGNIEAHVSPPPSLFRTSLAPHSVVAPPLPEEAPVHRCAGTTFASLAIDSHATQQYMAQPPHAYVAMSRITSLADPLLPARDVVVSSATTHSAPVSTTLLPLSLASAALDDRGFGSEPTKPTSPMENAATDGPAGEAAAQESNDDDVVGNEETIKNPSTVVKLFMSQAGYKTRSASPVRAKQDARAGSQTSSDPVRKVAPRCRDRDVGRHKAKSDKGGADPMRGPVSIVLVATRTSPSDVDLVSRTHATHSAPTSSTPSSTPSMSSFRTSGAPSARPPTKKNQEPGATLPGAAHTNKKKDEADEAPQLVSDGIAFMYDVVRARMKAQAVTFMTRHMATIRANYLWFLREHKNRGGPMGCYAAEEFASGQLPLMSADTATGAKMSAVVTMLPLHVTRLPPTALVTSWMLPASLVHARKCLLPREQAEIGETMNPRDVCLWFLVADRSIAKLKDYLSFYVPDGVRHMRRTDLSDADLAALFARVIAERTCR
jgi:hypothetical protein